MIPILFEYNATDFTTHGLGDLIDCMDCLVQQNDEGEYELRLIYPVTGLMIKELTIGRLIYVKANPWDQNKQIFRIYGYEKEIAGRITVNCQHISYDLANIPVKVFKSDKNANANTVLGNVKSNAVNITGLNISKFTFSSNVTGKAQTEKGYFEVDVPTTVRAAILDGDESVKGCFGGDLIFDNYTVKLQATGGTDRGVIIEYGIDLMDLNQEENISEMYTGVLPYYSYTENNNENTPKIQYGDIQYTSGTFRTHKIFPLDLTSYFPDQEDHTAPSVSNLNKKAKEWMSKEDGFGQPEINLTLSYASLGQDIRLYDAVKVKFVKMDIEVTSKVSSYTYDVLNERVTEIEVGKARPSILFSLEDASRLRKGLLPPERIKNNSITEDKYASGSVGGGAIKNNAVSGYHMTGGAVGNRELGNDAVEEENIKDGAVVEKKIDDNAVVQKKIKDKAVAFAKLHGDLQVQWTDILAANAIFANTIHADGSITTTAIQASNGNFNSIYFGNSYLTKGSITFVVDVDTGRTQTVGVVGYAGL